MVPIGEKMSKTKISILVLFSILLIGSIGLICYLQRSRYILSRVSQAEQLIMEQQQITTTMMPEARVQMCRFGCLKKVKKKRLKKCQEKMRQYVDS